MPDKQTVEIKPEIKPVREFSPVVTALIAEAWAKQEAARPLSLAEKISAAVKEKKPKAFRYENTTSAPNDV